MSLKLRSKPDDLDKSKIIWRYIDLSKFLDLLETEELFFCRVDKLFDNHEGAITKAQRELDRAIIKSVSYLGQRIIDIDHEEDKKYAFVNCWHLSEIEDYAMWRIYGASTNSIAIRSTIDAFEKSLIIEPAVRKQLDIERVFYIDHKKEEFKLIDVKNPQYFHKIKIYKYEKELRALIKNEFNLEDHSDENHLKIKFGEYGVRVPININMLIKEIYVSPNCPEWFYSMIKKLVVKRYNHKIEINRSIADNDPVFNQRTEHA